MGVVPLRRPLLHAPYEVALQCPHTKVPYTMAKKLVKPCAIKIFELFLGKDAARNPANVSLSNDVISSRAMKMSPDVLD